jgi:hypothetical protein
VGSRSRARARAKASEAPAPAAVAAAPPRPSRPPTLAIASVIEALEALLVLAAAVLAGVETGRGHSYQLSSGIAITIIGVVTAGALGMVAAGLAQVRRWTRTPALLTQLFTGIVAIYLLQGGRLEWGIPAIALGAAGLAAMLAPPSTRALTAGMRQPADRHLRD